MNLHRQSHTLVYCTSKILQDRSSLPVEFRGNIGILFPSCKPQSHVKAIKETKEIPDKNFFGAKLRLTVNTNSLWVNSLTGML